MLWSDSAEIFNFRDHVLVVFQVAEKSLALYSLQESIAHDGVCFLQQHPTLVCSLVDICHRPCTGRCIDLVLHVVGSELRFKFSYGVFEVLLIEHPRIVCRVVRRNIQSSSYHMCRSVCTQKLEQLERDLDEWLGKVRQGSIMYPNGCSVN